MTKQNGDGVLHLLFFAWKETRFLNVLTSIINFNSSGLRCVRLFEIIILNPYSKTHKNKIDNVYSQMICIPTIKMLFKGRHVRQN